MINTSVELSSRPGDNALLRKQLLSKIGFAFILMILFSIFVIYDAYYFFSDYLIAVQIWFLFIVCMNIYNYFAYANQQITYRFDGTGLKVGEKAGWVKGKSTWKGLYNYINNYDYSEKYKGVIIYTNYPSLNQSTTFTSLAFIFTPYYANLFIPIQNVEDKSKLLEFLKRKVNL